MRKNLISTKVTNMVLIMMLAVTMIFTVTGCGNQESGTSQENNTVQTAVAETEEAAVAETAETEAVSGTEAASDKNVLGEGQTKITFIVVDADGNETDFEIHTDKDTVGDALLEHGLIEGDDSEYGLYVKTVNGITADYDVDQTYWAFYVNGEYASTGVDATPVQEGGTYTFKVEK